MVPISKKLQNCVPKPESSILSDSANQEVSLCSLYKAACSELQEVSESDSNGLYRNMADHAAGEFTQVLFEDVASDPHAAAHQVSKSISRRRHCARKKA